ncbi:MAG: endonuclease/exonuclease/phosphatase family protein [Acidobacteria bacterium]|nr:endonuclease/exonuclease/phosphatase family protein [Acidobacteriota bacterium]
MTRIATWNVNSVRARLPRVLEWLAEATPDIVLVQEIKATEETFPRAEIEDLGYNVAIRGQKTFNGVAILAREGAGLVHTEAGEGPAKRPLICLKRFQPEVRIFQVLHAIQFAVHHLLQHVFGRLLQLRLAQLFEQPTPSGLLHVVQGMGQELILRNGPSLPILPGFHA